MKIMAEICEKAKQNKKTIVFPEGNEKRTCAAAAILVKEGLTDVILLGTPEEVRQAAAETGADIAGIPVIDPGNSPKTEEYAQEIYELRKAKGVTPGKAAELARDPMYYGIMMVKMGDADGLVSGALHSTGDMLRPALQLIKTMPGRKVVSSSFLMECPNPALGKDGLLVYSDGVVMPNPTADELAEIAVSAAETAKNLCGIEEPRVALLSFSTKGSADHALVDKVREAVEKAHALAPDLILDGELQFDAAIVPEIGASKAPGSPVAGRANVLIFPDLQAGNIGYKITQRIGGAECFAVLQGLAKPCNDLSRGCSVDDIVNTAVCTAVQAQAGM